MSRAAPSGGQPARGDAHQAEAGGYAWQCGGSLGSAAHVAALEQRLNKAGQWARTIDTHLGTVDARLDGVDARLGALELQLDPQQPISEEQAADLALAVKAVASALEQSGTKNGYQRVYGELYRRQGITSYKRLPRATFDTVLAWLKAWHAELSTGEASQRVEVGSDGV